MRSLSVQSFAGIRNTVPARSIPNNALADAIDIDIDDSGALLGRNGYTLSKSVSISSAYSTLAQVGYIVSGGTLYRVEPDSLNLFPLATSTATEFDDFGSTLWANDGLKIDGDRIVNLKLETPASPLSLSSTDGNLPAGLYSVTYTYKRASDGMESGSAPIATIELSDNQNIAISGATAPNGYTIRYYLTDAGGAVFYALDNGAKLDDALLLADPFPDDVEKIAYFGGKVYASKGRFVWFSAAFYHHLYDLQRNCWAFPGTVLAMTPANEALIIGTGDSIYAANDSGIQQIAAYGVIPGRPLRKTIDGRVFMHTKRGQCVGLPFENLTEKKASLAPGDQCSTAVVEQDGIAKFVVLTDGYGIPYNRA